ncbi:MAG: hypothetical protein N2Z57_08435, partial [Oscillospiraceae bacterium]|nr:hypothetical protein [Oscillospiraceae bacterium]
STYPCKITAIKNPLGLKNSPYDGVFFLNSILNVDYALNTVVIKCGVGMAQAACASFDKMFFPDVVGTIAGDDTIFVLMRNEPAAMGLCKLLQSQLKK